MTKIYCKSDCEFSQNEERYCSLDSVQLSQMNPNSPEFTCAQYVRAYGRTVREIPRDKDIEYSRLNQLKEQFAKRAK